MSNHEQSLGGRVGREPRHYHPQHIAGQCAIVTGGTTGIGLAIAKLLAERGARVLVYSHDEKDLKPALDELRQYGEAYGLTADQSRSEEVQRVFREADARFGGVDILINNAAVAGGTVADTEISDLRYTIDTNLLGYMVCAREAIQRMKSKGSGHIVNIGSMSADERAQNDDIYTATKAGIQAFSESLRKTVNPQGIKVSLIEPGLVGSAMNQGSEEEQRQKQEAGEMLHADDIAECVHYCLTQPPRCDVVEVKIRPHQQTI